MFIALIDIQYKLKKKRKGLEIVRGYDIKYKIQYKMVDKLSMRCYNEFVK